MKTTGIFFGSTSGTTEGIAQRIAEKLGVNDSDIHDVSNASVADTDQYEVLFLGTSTWGSGDLQDDWYSFVEELKAKDLSGKLVGLFGCGDSSSFSDTYCNGMGELYSQLQGTGCKFIGAVDASGYTFDDSTANVDGKFVGLAIDEVNEDDKTDERIDAWAESIKSEIE